MQIQIEHLKSGALKARGVTVVIDVFRAFTVEAFMFQKGIRKVYPVKTVKEAFELKKLHPDWILCGERNGKKVEGFDVGNSPSQINRMDLAGKTAIHTTSAGVQGLVNCHEATRIYTGALANAKATAECILKEHPERVTLVAMGWNGERRTEEDELCADYLKSLLEENPLKEVQKLADDLKYTEGKKFFDPAQQDVFPEEDFQYCTRVDALSCVLEVENRNGILCIQNRK